MTTRTAPISTPMVPKAALVAMASIALFALIATAAVRMSGIDIREPDAPAVAVRELRFEDRSDGAIVVTDARDGSRVATFEGEQGFVRGVLRGFARERKLSGLGAGPPFELIGRADGRLTLRDPATGRIVDLESFGPTNAGAFARLFGDAPQRP
jgi:putative photosynthetic complex assembly protein